MVRTDADPGGRPPGTPRCPKGPRDSVTATLGAGPARPGEPAGEPGQPQPEAAARWRALAAVVRRHWLATALLAAGLVLRVLAQFSYRPVLFYIDTTRYLYNVAPGMDPLGYKGVLRAILSVASLGTVAAIQHLLGPLGPEVQVREPDPAIAPEHCPLRWNATARGGR